MKGDNNPRIAAIREHLDGMVGTFAEWVEANLPDDSSPESSTIRDLLHQYRQLVEQRKAAITSAWVAGPPFTVLDELLDRTDGSGRDGDELASAQSALFGAIKAFQAAKRSRSDVQ